MVNEHSAVTNIQERLESPDYVNRVLVAENTERHYVFEVYVDNHSSVGIVNSEFPMLVETYGADVTKETSNSGEPYYRFEISGGALIDNR